MKESTKNQIENMLKENKIFLFMKGTPSSPRCGFSSQAVEILKIMGAHFNHFDVLENEEIRQGIKEYSEFPTIPQVFINQKLIGGSDILTDLYESGELENLLSQPS